MIRSCLLFYFFLFGLHALGQGYPMTFVNRGKPITIGKDTFHSSRIHEIIVNPDSTFEFWSRPHTSCFTWHQYKGSWKKEGDTLVFSDNYEIVENSIKATYKKDERQSFFISFKTDKNSELKNKAVKVQFDYDFYANLEDLEMTFDLGTANTLDIPYKDIPYFNQLAAIRIEYQLNFKEKRVGYLTENKTINIKQGPIPNLINVEFIENPKKETVYRTIKGVVQESTLVILLSTKTKVSMPDDNADIQFEESYLLNK